MQLTPLHPSINSAAPLHNGNDSPNLVCFNKSRKLKTSARVYGVFQFLLEDLFGLVNWELEEVEARGSGRKPVRVDARPEKVPDCTAKAVCMRVRVIRHGLHR